MASQGTNMELGNGSLEFLNYRLRNACANEVCEETVNSVNCYEDANRANAYATLEFANTYYLAYRDLPEILSAHVIGLRALDFGCGTGRSTRMLRKLGFDVTGVDISEDMLHIAKVTDPSGDYRLVLGDNLEQFSA